MKILVSPTQSEERASIWQKLRLARPSVLHGACLTVRFDKDEVEGAHALDRTLLEKWAGPQLKELAAEFSAGRRKGSLAEMTVAKPLGGPEEIAPLTLRARIFADLVSFAVAEQRLAAEAKRGLRTDGELAGAPKTQAETPAGKEGQAFRIEPLGPMPLP